MKKIVSLLLATVLASSLLCGCVKESPEPVYIPPAIDEKDREKVDQWIRDVYGTWGKKMLRGKGYFNIAGSDYRFDFQSVRTNFHAKTEETWEDEESRETVAVFIGTELPSREELMNSLSACIAEDTTERKLA